MRYIYLLLLLALIGVGITVEKVAMDNRPVANPVGAVSMPQVPFKDYVAGAGILEATTQNIAIGTAVSGIVTDIYVTWGEQVKKGNPLFKIDDRDAQARLTSAIAAVKEAQANLEKAVYLSKKANELKTQGVVSTEEYTLRQTEMESSKAAVDVAKSQVGEIRTEIERRTVRAPVAGRVLRIDIRLGESASSGPTASPLMLLGDSSVLNVRAEIDEQDAWRVKPGAKAMAFVRGNPELKIPLEFQRIEPYVLPKTTLTGSGAERSDTRVLQVIYSFSRASWPVYIGQEMDVYIEAPVAPERGR